MLRGADKWLAGYLRSVWRRPAVGDGTRHLFFCVADHFEPFRGGVDRAAALEAVARWTAGYAGVTGAFRDADGRTPRHTFFYPGDEYDEEVLARLAALCAAGHGEVEVHLHHRADTAETLRAKLVAFRDRLHGRHGLLGADAAGAPRYAFVHGNWALCNSRPDGDWCGVDAELGVLQASGCYGDFTFPSAPSPTQPRQVNAIYRAEDCPGRRRGHDRGEEVRTLALSGATAAAPRGLLLVQGPLALNWGRRKWGVLPRLENAEISGANPPSIGRLRLWVRQGIHVRGRPDWVFVKVHTHGCVDANARVWLGPAAKGLHAALQADFNDGVRWRLHYVTARECYNLVRAAESGSSSTSPDGPLLQHGEIRQPACVG